MNRIKRETIDLFSPLERITPICCFKSSLSQKQYLSVFLQSSYKNSSRRLRRDDIFSNVSPLIVFLEILSSESLMISFRRGLSFVMIACSTTVLYDSVLLSKFKRFLVWRVYEGELSFMWWWEFSGWRDSSITIPYDFIAIVDVIILYSQ